MKILFQILKVWFVIFGIFAFAIFMWLFVLDGDCSEKSHQVIAYVDRMNHKSKGRYRVYLDRCRSEICIVNQENAVDSALFHDFLVGLTRAENQRYLVNVYSKDSLLLYVQFAEHDRDTTYHIVDHYEY
jgi:hypothetical protein